MNMKVIKLYIDIHIMSRVYSDINYLVQRHLFIVNDTFDALHGYMFTEYIVVHTCTRIVCLVYKSMISLMYY